MKRQFGNTISCRFWLCASSYIKMFFPIGRNELCGSTCLSSFLLSGFCKTTVGNSFCLLFMLPPYSQKDLRSSNNFSNLGLNSLLTICSFSPWSHSNKFVTVQSFPWQQDTVLTTKSLFHSDQDQAAGRSGSICWHFLFFFKFCFSLKKFLLWF